ncbi:MAG: hypothetical protein HY788_08245 [Deltaproteobacteria bacterium]|nr:hypothetical protein [Deltaproteobacteria bacterium]
MDKEIREKIQYLVSIFRQVERNKNRIESKTGFVITNAKYYENLRHSFSHLNEALFFLSEDPDPDVDNFVKQLDQAEHHLSNLDVNGYEYLAGELLNDLTDRIDRAGFFHSIGNADEYRKNALRQFDIGREKRTANKAEAMTHFENCVTECEQGLKEITPISRIDRASYNIQVITGLIALIALVVAIVALSN